MNVIDLTHVVHEGMPVFPETDQPRIEGYATVPKEGFRESIITIDSHTGTHVDPPAHAIADGMTLDQFPPSQFVGRALVVDCRDVPSGGHIGLERVQALGTQAGVVDFLLFNTGRHKLWGTGAYFENIPLMTDELIDAIAAGQWKGIGFDLPSIDAVEGGSMRRHQRLFRARPLINIENLCDLGQCGSSPFWFCCLPLRTRDADGCPVRALAILDE